MNEPATKNGGAGFLKRNSGVIIAVALVLGAVAGFGAISFSTSTPASTAISTSTKSPDETVAPRPPRRLASLAPSLTETVFALGAGELLVGVTRQCRHPEAVLALPKIGDYMGPDYEALLLARPDLVLVLEEHAPAFPRFEALGLAYKVFDHRTLAGLTDSFEALGALLERPDQAASLRARLEAAGARHAHSEDNPGAETRAEERAEEQAGRPRVLLVVGRDYSASRPRQVYAAGRGNLYDELLTAAGARNAYAGPVSFPMLEEEGLLALNPDAIVELLGMEPGMPGAEESLSVWSRVEGLRAARTGRIKVISGDAAFVPGPRTAGFVDELADAVKAMDAAKD